MLYLESKPTHDSWVICSIIRDNFDIEKLLKNYHFSTKWFEFLKLLAQLQHLQFFFIWSLRPSTKASLVECLVHWVTIVSLL